MTTETYGLVGGHIAVRRGTYGPAHDPYSYEEITVKRRGRPTATLHTGLGVWSAVGRRKLERHYREDFKARERREVARFERACGLTMDQIRRALAQADRRRNARCPWGDWRHDPMGSPSMYE